MRALFERHIETKVLSPLTRIFCFFPRCVVALDDSRAAKEGARAGGEEEATAEGPTATTAAVGGGGTAGPRTM
jgi:hypothetical protein